MKRIRALFRDLPLFTKLMVMYLVAAVLPILLIAAFSYRRTERQLTDVAYRNMYNTNLQINDNISAQLDLFRHVSSNIYTDDILRAYLTQNYARDYDFVEAYRYIDNRLYSLLAANGNIDRILISIYNASMPADGLFVEHIDTNRLPPALLARLEKTYGEDIFGPVTTNANGEYIFHLARVLNYNTQGQPYGILSIAIREDLLYSLIKKESINKDIYLLAQDGSILSAANKDMLNRPFTDATGVALPMDSNSGSEIVQVNGSDYLMVYNTMRHGWKTVSLIPYSTIAGEARKTSGQILVIALVSLLLSTAMVAVISKYMTGRLNALRRQATRVETGDFSAVISNTPGRDEIGLLANAFNRMTQRLNVLVDELIIKEKAKRDAELYALQSQINPHFLYNTLSVIASLAIQNGDGEVSAIVNHLSKFYQTSLNMGRERITIESELAITKHYLAIQHMRFGQMFTEHWEVDDRLLQSETLKLLIQPFVENAINHAVCDEENTLDIVIRVYAREDGENHAICFEIEDNGAGISAERLEKLMDHKADIGYGVYNVHERVQIAYGGGYGVTISSNVGVGTKVCIAIPCAKNPDIPR